ncbi:LacI family DNA-binding transcriptional regulator [Alteribacillus sp. HJP-4]|uniref:LacI family DNA-binding transcriptional regulator n=1 Tax=Alteribacillus sp. HJP-4 TaxID=2775394 RepID=UPI0035CD02EB
MATIYDIAKRANVSPMTVSRVINNTGNTKQETRNKVEAAIKELNYIPNSAARSLTLKKSKILMLLIPDITNPFFTKLARGAEDKARQAGYKILLSNTDENADKEAEYIKSLISTGVDGVIFTPANDTSSKNLKLLTRHRIPYVLTDRLVENIQADAVLGDNFFGMKQLLQHLTDHQHKNIALVNGPADVYTARERKKAFTEVMKLHQLNDHHMYEMTFTSGSDAKKVVNQLQTLDDVNRPTAIIAGNNFIAVNLIKELRSKNVNVPKDMSLVCFDDLEQASEIDPFLTAVKQPAYDFGYISAQFLIERIEQSAPPSPREVVLKSELVVRKSTKKRSRG